MQVIFCCFVLFTSPTTTHPPTTNHPPLDIQHNITSCPVSHCPLPLPLHHHLYRTTHPQQPPTPPPSPIQTQRGISGHPPSFYTTRPPPTPPHPAAHIDHQPTLQHTHTHTPRYTQLLMLAPPSHLYPHQPQPENIGITPPGEGGEMGGDGDGGGGG